MISPWWLIPPALLFLALVLWHQFVFVRLSNARRAALFYERGIARLEDGWQERGETGERFRTADHVYADDLDVLGKGSLYELLCTVRTPMAEQTLAEWLLNPAGKEEVEQRQHAVAELRSCLDLREDLFLVGDLVRRDVRSAALMAWGESEPVVFAGLLRMFAPVLATATALLLILDLTDILPLWPFLLALLIELSIIFALRKKVNHVAEAVEEPARALDLVAAVLRRFEREQFDLPYLQRLRAGFEQATTPASRHIERLQRYATRLDWSHNQFFLPIAAVLLWREQLALRIEDWRREHGRQVGKWLASVAELEVLCAIAGYAFDHPSDPFPEIVSGEAVLDAQGIAHPLMKAAVRNELSLGHGTSLLIVSGSNMSGKSTLLRTIGLNAVLALAGAPVRAQSLRLSPMSIAASIRVVDSLADRPVPFPGRDHPPAPHDGSGARRPPLAVPY